MPPSQPAPQSRRPWARFGNWPGPQYGGSGGLRLAPDQGLPWGKREEGPAYPRQRGQGTKGIIIKKSKRRPKGSPSGPRGHPGLAGPPAPAAKRDGSTGISLFVESPDSERARHLAGGGTLTLIPNKAFET